MITGQSLCRSAHKQLSPSALKPAELDCYPALSMLHQCFLISGKDIMVWTTLMCKALHPCQLFSDHRRHHSALGHLMLTLSKARCHAFNHCLSPGADYSQRSIFQQSRDHHERGAILRWYRIRH